MEWHRAFTAKHKKEHVILPVITILIGILLTFIIAMMYWHYQESITRSELELNAMTYAEHIRADIVNGIGATTAIEEILISNGSINRFPAVTEDLPTDALQSIQLAPDGYVREIYPEEGNEAGKIDLINDPDRGEISRYSRDNHVLTMQGPFNLKQGGSGIAVRNPVYLE